jgi:hypothetical protein
MKDSKKYFAWTRDPSSADPCTWTQTVIAAESAAVARRALKARGLEIERGRIRISKEN